MKNLFPSNSMNLLLQVSCLIMFLLLNPLETQAQDILLDCPSSSPNYTSGSSFETNLKTLLPSLISNGSINGYFNSSFGNNPDTVYGLVQCRGDISMEKCKFCLNQSYVLTTQKCLNKKSVTMRLDTCLLRFSDTNFFTKGDIGMIVYVRVGDASDPVTYNKTLGDLLDDLSSKAVLKQSKFEVGSSRYADFKNVYGMVQCTQDLSTTSCSTCLEFLIGYIPQCCSAKISVHILSSSCFIRFANDIFYELSAPPPPPLLLSPTPPPPPLEGSSPQPDVSGNGSSSNVVAIVVPTVTGGVLLFLAISLCFFKRKRWMRATTYGALNEDAIVSAESLQFDLVTVKVATRDFSDAYKLGEGGFGAVYKGVLPDGQEIAVKRLSSGSQQGSQEFKNEVVLLHKLQHRNLVRLMGFCLEKEEKILIYEYVANRSLDKYLFDSSRKLLLDWGTRYKIIGGIARGLLYLHEDSRLKIIHRDLKAGNILLDDNMSPKIADFGLAKLFVVDQTQGNTSKIAGTYGYMAPEYALHGLFSVKSDVYSFGVLILEIVSGRKIITFYQTAPPQDLLSYAWKKWREGTSLELMDLPLGINFSRNEVMRCIHIGLLCVQENIEDRPTMSAVVLMLNSPSFTLPPPSQPTSFEGSTTRSSTVRREQDSNHYRSSASASSSSSK